MPTDNLTDFMTTVSTSTNHVTLTTSSQWPGTQGTNHYGQEWQNTSMMSLDSAYLHFTHPSHFSLTQTHHHRAHTRVNQIDKIQSKGKRNTKYALNISHS